MKTSDWHNKVCLVTGGSSGLGYSLARAFAEHGAKVIITARSAEPLLEAAANLGANIEAIAADVTRDDEVQRLHDAVVERYGRLDVLCNCAGRSTRGMAIDATVADFQELLDLNFLAAVRVTRIFAPLLLEQHGHVVNIASLAGKVAPRYLGAYPASKFALAAYSQQLRLELAAEGLHVLLVCPGPIKRDNAAPRYAQESANLPDSARQPAAGAKLRGIDPDWLAQRIVTACERREPELVVPWKVRLLLAIGQLSPKLGDWLLLRSTSGQEDAASTKSALTSSKFRWRVIPVGIIGTIAAILVLAGVFAFFLMIYTTWTGRPLYEPGPSGFSYEGCAAGACWLVTGFWLYVSAKQWWRGHWWRAIAMIATLFLVVRIAIAAGVLPE